MLRLFIGCLGVTLAIFFQAWGLPIFLCLALIIGWVVNYRFPQKGVSQDFNSYISGLAVLFFISFAMIFLAGLNRVLVANLLNYWNEISIVNVSIFKSRHTTYDEVLNPKSVVFAMNFVSLTVPLVVALNYHKLIGPLSIRAIFTQAERLKYMLAVVAIFVFSAFFSFWMLKASSLGGLNSVTFIFIAYYIQTAGLAALFYMSV